jgi:demethylmenaquinone methyltransferase/2-methoxy-6-polyprenyl-1,4-benzoquinol methylase
VEVTPLPAGDAKTALVRAIFERIAPRYDRMNRLISLGLDRRWRELTLGAIAIGPGDVVLDLACGTGDLSESAAARGARVIGVDLAREMLRAARRRRVPAGFALGDASALPLRDACASAVVCGFALRNFTSLERAFGEVARVLRSEGRAAFLEVGTPTHPLARAGHRLWFERAVPWLGGLFADREAYRYLPRSVAYLPPAAELTAMLERSGLGRVRIRPLFFGAAQLVTAVRT